MGATFFMLWMMGLFEYRILKPLFHIDPGVHKAVSGPVGGIGDPDEFGGRGAAVGATFFMLWMMGLFFLGLCFLLGTPPAKGQVAGGVFIVENGIEEQAKLGDGAALGHQSGLPQIAGAVVGLDDMAQLVRPGFGSPFHRFALVFPDIGEAEAIDRLWEAVLKVARADGPDRRRFPAKPPPRRGWRQRGLRRRFGSGAYQ